ncbi:MAG: nucleotidyltransferase [Halobacteriovoraceae bacterium]|nr:nucleotidyltransferase [Halobacteriovoraceae bacterium]
MQDLSKLLKTLLANDIDFVLIGGFAAVVHGSTLVTQDLDICSAMSIENINKLRSVLKDLNPTHRMDRKANLSFLDHPKSLDGLNNIYLDTDLGILDILSATEPAGNFETIKKNAIDIPLYGFTCKVISIDDLIKVKTVMNRPKDIQAVIELKKVKELESK